MLSVVLQNSIVVLLLTVSCILVRRLVRQPYWPVARRALGRNRAARLSFVVLCVYAAIGVCDSIVWRDPLMDARGRAVFDHAGGQLYRAAPLSVLDRLCTPIRTAQEKTYGIMVGCRLVDLTLRLETQSNPLQTMPLG